MAAFFEAWSRLRLKHLPSIAITSPSVRLARSANPTGKTNAELLGINGGVNFPEGIVRRVAMLQAQQLGKPCLFCQAKLFNGNLHLHHKP
ncbi:hypothetical protein BCL69_105920 [Nitrosomonas communis]|uniref:Uncharacterized protein n=1 Tax=Nitrosomonas communis TaxID=44574 RepID=A0A5D3YB67_9PROT|nr:hypothetical protein BCL69_105920 [Nitrosomonas communis]